MIDLNYTWIIGGMIVAFFGGGFAAFIALFGWSLAKTVKNARDLGVFHSQRRELDRRIKRIENHLNGEIGNARETSLDEQDILDEPDCCVSSNSPRRL